MWETPRQLLKIFDETIVERTIRLLRDNGISDISVTANGNAFDFLNVDIIHHNNSYEMQSFAGWVTSGYWVDAFPQTSEPTCFLFGDVFYSDKAIETIINTNTDGIEFFASCPPFNEHYIKKYAEPLAFKVVNTQRFATAIEKTKQLQDEHKFKRTPIAWELWQVIKNTPLNVIDYTNYTVINDYSCDIDRQSDISKLTAELSNIWQSI